jgi:hypothetical protein
MKTIKSIFDIALTGTAMNMVGSTMTGGFKDATNVVLGAGLLKRTAKNSGFKL